MMIIFHLELLECKGCLNPLNSHLPWTWDQDFNCWNYQFYVNSRPYLHLEGLSIPQNSLIVALIIVLVNENLDTVGDIKKNIGERIIVSTFCCSEQLCNVWCLSVCYHQNWKVHFTFQILTFLIYTYNWKRNLRVDHLSKHF